MTQSFRDSAETPWATTVTAPPAHAGVDVAREGPPLAAKAHDDAPHEIHPPVTAPALTPPTWSGKKTAIAAALAIGFSSVGTIGAAAALPEGLSSQSGPGGGQPGPGGRQLGAGGDQQFGAGGQPPNAATT